MILNVSFIFCVIISVTAGGDWGIPDPLDVASNIAKVAEQGVKATGTAVISGAETAANATYEADRQVIEGTKSALGKIHNGVFDIEKGFVNGVDEVVGTPVDLKEVTFWLATEKNIESPKQINFYKPDDVADTKGKIFFLIHGWQSSRNTSWFHDLSSILVKRYSNAHVVQVNWDGPASDNYAFAAFDTESVGNFLGILINRLVTEYKIPRENIVLIGHSLGGQISGWAAKKFGEITGQKLPRIIALDPAGPLFILRPDSRRLNKKDAEVVMVIHTDADKLGFPLPCGTVDFFPNGGDNQPGCWEVDLSKVSTYAEPVTCDHSRAWDFFLEAVNSTGSFPSRKCSSFNEFRKNICEAIEVAMGDLGTAVEGKFYLETHPHRNYSKLLPQIIEKVKEEIEDVKKNINDAKQSTSHDEGKNHTMPVSS